MSGRSVLVNYNFVYVGASVGDGHSLSHRTSHSHAHDLTEANANYGFVHLGAVMGPEF